MKSSDCERSSGTIRHARVVSADVESSAGAVEAEPASCRTEGLDERSGSVADAKGQLRHLSRPRFALGWLDGIPLPAALVTPTGEIAAASLALNELTQANGVMVGLSLPTLFWPEGRQAASALIAHPSSNPAQASTEVVLLATGLPYRLHVGAPLGAGQAAMRLAVLAPQPEDSLPVDRENTGQRSRGGDRGSIPAPPNSPERPLQGLAGLPITSLVIVDGRIAAVTQRAATLLGVPAELLEGMPVEDIMGAAAVAELFAEKSGESHQWQPRALPAFPLRIDGAIRGCACCLIPFGRPNVGLLLLEGWGGTTIDTPTEDSRQSSAGYLIAGVAHEINNPLAFILPILNELKADLSGRRESMRALPIDTWISQLDEALDGVARIAGVVQNLRAAREATPDVEPTLVNQVIANTLRLATVSVPPSISVRRDLGLVLPARGNRQRLAQVVLNLVMNAAHALEDDSAATGTIFVRTWGDSHYTWLEVRDDGPGVPEEHRERIFEPFFTTRAKGSGLGLAVCRAMIRELGGELTLEHVESRGACFRIRLPVWHAAVEKSHAEGVTPTTEKRNDVKRRRVLLVDDDPPVRRALRRMLSGRHQVDEAASLQEAVEKVQLGDYDVLVTDLVMSHGGGPALIEKLRQVGARLADHVVVISGMAPDASPLPFPRLTKPCTADDLLAAIEQVAPRASATG